MLATKLDGVLKVDITASASVPVDLTCYPDRKDEGQIVKRSLQLSIILIVIA